MGSAERRTSGYAAKIGDIDMYYMITWFGKKSTQYSKGWMLNEKNGERAVKYLTETARAGWYRGQLEKGHNTGRLHIQLMIEASYSLDDMIAIGNDRGWDWHVESIEDMEEGALYVGKTDTRVDGPWESMPREKLDFEGYYLKRDWEHMVDG